MMKHKDVLFVLFVVTLSVTVIAAVPAEKQSWFYKGLEYIDVAVREPGYHIWGCSPVMDPNGTTHLFVSRWANTVGFDTGWRTIGEIAHYVAPSPEGPFAFSDLVLDGSDDPADPLGQAPVNSCIFKSGNTYALLYIARAVGGSNATQKIGMATATSPYGPWTKVGDYGVILERPTDPSYWNYNAGNGVVNPAILQHADGRFFLYFKSQDTRPGYANVAKMGVAVADRLEGPYIQLPEPITTNDLVIEDGYSFVMHNRYYLVTTDNHGLVRSGGGLFWRSDDGIKFNEDNYLAAYDVLAEHIPSEYWTNPKTYYGWAKMERPQVLIIDGKPGYFYAPAGTNIEGGDATISYLFKFNPDNLSCGDWGYLPEDINKDCVVDSNDITILANDWLK